MTTAPENILLLTYDTEAEPFGLREYAKTKKKRTSPADRARNKLRAKLIMLYRSDFRCTYCGFDFLSSPRALSCATKDHFQPHTGGGGDDPENIVPCCDLCNKIKGSRRGTVEEMRQFIRGEREKFARQIQDAIGETPIPFRRKNRIIGLFQKPVMTDLRSPFFPREWESFVKHLEAKRTCFRWSIKAILKRMAEPLMRAWKNITQPDIIPGDVCES
jgi:5-methylcytosine-specific restriction endonuclease McrA